MATSADIGANFSNQGNPLLGGADGGAFNINTQPLMQLAAYTNLYNKSVWDQNQKDTDAKVAELSSLADIQLNNLIGKDKDYLSKKWVAFQNYASDFARHQPTSPEDKLRQQLEWQTKYGEFMNDYNSGKQRAVSYHAQLNQIKNNVTDPSLQDVKIKQLNKQFDSTDIGTPISALPQYKLQNIDIPKPITQDFDMVQIGGDQNVNTKATVYNPALNSGQADATVLGIKKTYPAQGTPAYDQLSDAEKQQADQQQTIESNGKIWSDMTVPLNQAIAKYTNTDGTFDAARFENDNASNSVVMTAYNALKKLNEYSTDHYNQAVNGTFNDKGLSYQLPANVSANDFKAGFVNFGQPITPAQLVQAGTFSQFQGDTSSKDVKETGKATQLQIAQQGRASMERIAANTQAGENYRKRLDLLEKGASFDKKGNLIPSSKNAKADVDIVKPAMLFNEHVDRLKNIFANPNAQYTTVNVTGIDNYTKQALNINPDTDKAVQYDRDGSYKIIDKDGKVRTIGTIDNLSQGYINAVNKNIAPSKAAIPAIFQSKSEQAFKNTFGTNSAKDIWDNWNNNNSANKPIQKVDEYGVPIN